VIRVGTEIGGRYRLLRVLASGGMGAVFEAVQIDLGRRVAIKVMLPELGSDRVSNERFEREARAAASLGHPNIAQVQDFGRTAEGEPYLVMEYLDGRTLMDALIAEQRFSPERVVAIFRQLLEALAATHRVGIVHRDLKASNVFLVPIAGGDLVKVLDFGVAKIKESEAHAKLTRTGVIVGTPQYMPPEQMRGEDVDERADIYCTGVMMFMALAGRRPFEGDGAELTRQVILAGAPPLAKVAPQVSPALAAIVDKALLRDRNARFASAAEMLDALVRSSLVPARLGSYTPPNVESARAPVEAAPPTVSRAPTWKEVGIAPTSAAPPPARAAVPRSHAKLRTALAIPAAFLAFATCMSGAILAYRWDDFIAIFGARPPPETDRDVTLPPASADPPDDVYVTGFEGNGVFDRFDVMERLDRHQQRWLGCFREAAPRLVDGRRWHPGLWQWHVAVDVEGDGTVIGHDPGGDPLPSADACMRSLLEDIEWAHPRAPASFMVRIAISWED
jgi:predicted Ser/Thr protein kinase